MDTLKARVVNGRLVLDEPVDLPDGTILELVVADPGDSMDEAQRAALDAELEAAWAGVKNGDLVDHDDVMNVLNKR